MTDESIRKSTLFEKLITEYSIREIIKIFANIDDKIMSLHECSAEDFRNFNAQLKLFFKQAKKISENAQVIFDIIGGKDSRIIFNEFNSFHEKLKIHVDFFEKELSVSITTLSKILTNLNFMFVPFKNFSQNILTLKFLFTNMKLQATTEDNLKEQELEVAKIEELINHIKANYPAINEEMNCLKKSIKQTLNKLENINKRKEDNVETILSQIHYNINFLSSRHEEALIQIPKLTQKTEHCFNNISKIITSLQYQDIIRQKMENLQETYKELIKELNQMDGSDNDQIILFKQAKYAAQIPYIAELQIAQLLQTNTEYQKAIQVITNKFLEVSEDMTTVAEMSQNIASNTHKSEETHFDQIREKLSDASYLIQEFTIANKDFTTEIDNIHSAVSKMIDNFSFILDLDTKLQDLAIKLISTTSSNKKATEISKISQQIKTITGDIRFNMSKTQILFDQTKVLIGDLHSSFAIESSIKESSENLANKVNTILHTIDSENQKIINILKENENLSAEISNKLKLSFEQVKYYDFFEKIIEEIITELNAIYKKLEFESVDAAKKSKAQDLKNIEEFYTTKSEREVHNVVVGNEDILDDENEDEIEFF